MEGTLHFFVYKKLFLNFKREIGDPTRRVMEFYNEEF